MKKKLGLILLALITAISIFTLSACGGSDNDTDGDTSECSHRDKDDDGVCDKCDESYSDEKDVEDEPTHTHNYGAWIEEIPASCTANGTLGHYTCSDCGKNFDSNKTEITNLVIPAAHNYGTWIAEIPATCTDNGTLGHYTCSGCNKNFDSNKTEITNLVIPAAHNYGTWIAEIPATCTDNGTLGHYTCSGCGKNFDSNKNELSSLVIISEGHNIVNEACTKCDFEIVYSEGLEFELVNNEYYRVVGIGTCQDAELYIPKTYNNLPVKEIVEGAFYSCDILTRITIPDSVTSIDDNAFSFCSNLSSVVIPNSVTSIGHIAFGPCVSLTSITVDEENSNYKSIDGNLYSKDGKTLIQYAIGKTETSFAIPDSVTRIAVGAFGFSENLTSVLIGDGVEIIDDSAFAYCENLKSVAIGNSVKSIVDCAFYGCTSLSSILIPDSVINIDTEAFRNCTSLTSVVIGNGVTSIGNSAFSDCYSLTSVTIGNGVTSIGDSAFSLCSSLTSVTIGNGVTSIGDSAFSDCYSLTSIVIPDSVINIGYDAFYSCESLISITIGNNVASIGHWAFDYCQKLVEVINKSSLNIIAGNYDYGELGFYAIEVHTGDSKIVNKDGYLFYNYNGVNYLVSYVGNDTVLTLPESYNGEKYEIYKRAFCNNDQITSVTIPDSVTSIGGYAFYYCTNLTSVTIGNNVTSIGDSAFFGCVNLTNVIIPDSIISIGYVAFGRCLKLVEVINKSSLNIIVNSDDYGYVGHYAIEVHTGDSKIVNKDGYLFYTYNGVNYLVNYVGNDTVLTLPESYNGENYEIYKYAFLENDKIISVTVPGSVTNIGEGAFDVCAKLVEVINKSSLNITKGSEEYGCVACYALEVHAGESKIVNKDGYLFYTFNGVNYLVNYIGNDTVLTLPESYNGENYVINDRAFYNNDKITSVTIPNSVTSIGHYSFYHCESLSGVKIGKSVTSIGGYAFYDSRLTIIKYRGSDAEWEAVSKDSYWVGDSKYILIYNYTGK